MGRRERELSPGPLIEFAGDLRRLRSDSGLTYRELERRAGYSASALSAAASGQSLPTLEVLLAYVGGCGGEARNWQRRWELLSGAWRDAERTAPPLPPRGLPAVNGGRQPRGEPAATAPAAVALAELAAPLESGGLLDESGGRPGPVGRWPRRRRVRPVVRLGVTPLILATALIIAYAVLRPGSPGTTLQTAPPVTGAFPAPSAIRPSQPAPRPSGAASGGGATAPGTGAAAGQPGGGQPGGSPQPAGQSPQPGGAQVRFGFESPGQQWGVFWGQQIAAGGITSDVAYQGSHSYEVTITGATASRGYSAIGTIHDLAGLTPGMHVTVHLWSSDPQDTEVRFWAMNSQSVVAWAPENPVSDIPFPAGSGWSAMTWTVPQVDQVHAIGIQVYDGTSAPLKVAVDNVAW
jgi:transcriptional regulator with XRE-family HTH domain